MMCNSFLAKIRLAGTYWRLPVGRGIYVDARTHVKAKSGEPHHARAVTIYGPLISDINDIFATTMLCVNERII